jgi:hypothetical protein
MKTYVQDAGSHKLGLTVCEIMGAVRFSVYSYFETVLLRMDEVT